MNSIFATEVLKTKFKDKSDFFIYEELSKSGAHEVRNQVTAVALKGMISLPDASGTNIDVQILIQPKLIGQNHLFLKPIQEIKAGIDCYGLCFWEQAYETIDELLKPIKEKTLLNVESVSIMGKAGILEGGKAIS
jgi:hypothetical protein